MCDAVKLKKELRKAIRREKRKFSFDEKKVMSDKILLKLEEDERFQNSETILAYWSMDDEVNTREFVIKWAEKKKIILPCVDGDNLVLKQFTGESDLVDGENFSIPEPKGEAFENIPEIDFAVIPGVAFDKDNNRMGRGRGYYDRTLNNLSEKCVKAGVCFDFQIADNVPVEEHDIKMDVIFTQIGD